MKSETGRRVGVLVIGRKRPGFDPEWGRTMEAAACAAIEATGATLVKPASPAVDDGTLRKSLAEIRAGGAATLVVLQPTMGDGRLAPLVGQLWGAPIVLFATPEKPETPKVTACSLVGAHAWAATLRQLGYPFEIVYGDPSVDLKMAIALTAAATRLRMCKIGLVGYHAPGFIDMHADPFTITRTFGVAMHHFGIDELAGLIAGVSDEAIAADLAAVKQMKLARDKDVSDDDLAPNARYHAAMNALMDTENLDAMAVRCWPELPNRYGHWPYVAMARMTEAGRVIALEGDVDGGLLGLMGKLIGLGPGYLSDWLEHDAETITLWHPGHAPLSLCAPASVRLSRHFNDNKPLVIDAEMREAEPITIARLWRCDNAYRMTATDARTIRPRKHFHGCSGLAALDVDVNDWFDTLVHEGMPHHVTIFPGQHAGMLRRMARLLGVKWVA